MDPDLMDPMELELRSLIDIVPQHDGTLAAIDTDHERCTELRTILFGELDAGDDGESDFQRDWLRRNTDYRWKLHHGIFQPRDLEHRRP